jgi:hypothetical protein
MYIFVIHIGRRFLWRGKDIPLIQRRGGVLFDLHFVLSFKSRKKWRRRPL